MNLCKRFLTGFCVSCSLLAIAIPSRADRVQTYLDTQLLAQASELEGLEQKDISDWGFTCDRRNVLPREEGKLPAAKSEADYSGGFVIEA